VALPFFNLSAGVPALSAFTQIDDTGSTAVSQAPTSKVISITDNGTGSSGIILKGLTYPAPAAPFRVAMLVSDSAGSASTRGLCWGFGDSSGKFAVMYRFNSGSAIDIVTFASASSYSGASSVSSSWTVLGSATLWLGLRSDGTTLYFEASADGVNFGTVYSEAIASSTLSGISNVFIGFSPQTATPNSALSIACFDPNGLTRSFP